MLRVGVIGLGVGQALADGLASHPDCRVTALCDRNVALGRRVAERHPKANVVADAGAILEDPDVDLAVIATWDDSHHDLVVRALQNNKHVFVEKPLCQHRDEAVNIRAALRDHPACRLSSNLILRLAPRFQRLRALVRDGTLGTLYYLEGDYNYGRINKLTDGWRGSLPFYSVVGGGGVHLIDLLQWVSGGAVVEVEAWGNQIASRGTRFRFDDLVVVLLRFASGAIGKVTVNMGCVFPHFHRLLAYGTRATFVNSPEAAMLYRSRDAAHAPDLITDPHPGVHKGALARSFVDTLLHGAAPIVSTDEVFQTMAVVLAADQALATGTRVGVQAM